jgi:hypothetical protein
MTVIIIMILTMKITKIIMESKNDGYCDDSNKNINNGGNS